MNMTVKVIPLLYTPSMWMISLKEHSYSHLRKMGSNTGPRSFPELRKFKKRMGNKLRRSSFLSSWIPRTKLKNSLHTSKSWEYIQRDLENEQSGDRGFKLRKLSGHQGPLGPDDPHYKGNKYNIMVE